MAIYRNVGLLILSALIISGCTQRFSYSLKNGTCEQITEATIAIGKAHKFNHGILIVGARSGFGGDITSPTACDVTVTWRDSFGATHSSSVRVTRDEILDKRHIVFRLEPDHTITKQWRFKSPPKPLEGI